MSGHSKWHNILATKTKTDAQRSAMFTKISREISVAVKAGGADVNSNSRLRLAIAKARANNMPNDKINSILKKNTEVVDYTETTYEGYGIGGVAVIVECLTDNKNRTAGDVRHIFDKYGGSLGANGCVSYLFTKKGVVVLDKKGLDVDKAVEVAIDNGAEDYEESDEELIVYTEANNFDTLAGVYRDSGYNVLSAENDMIASNYVTLTADQRQRFDTMIEMFEANDDVQNVYHNLDD
ncbi:MAG: YebC/PmpR family DNA-binding transcriptional regulator [Clostridia bacterium]|nr:YebC/PmpR family DNA-binding transcriptional regulator [Clostridia bacterium]